MTNKKFAFWLEGLEGPERIEFCKKLVRIGYAYNIHIDINKATWITINIFQEKQTLYASTLSIDKGLTLYKKVNAKIIDVRHDFRILEKKLISEIPL